MEPQAINEIVPEHKAGYWKLRHIRLLHNLISVLFYVCIGWLLREKIYQWLAPVYFISAVLRNALDLWMNSIKKRMGLFPAKSATQPEPPAKISYYQGLYWEFMGSLAAALTLAWTITLITDPTRHLRGTLILIILVIPGLVLTLIGLMALKQWRSQTFPKVFLPINVLLWGLKIVRGSGLVWLFWIEAAYLLIFSAFRYIVYTPEIENRPSASKVWTMTFRSGK